MRVFVLVEHLTTTSFYKVLGCKDFHRQDAKTQKKIQFYFITFYLLIR